MSLSCTSMIVELRMRPGSPLVRLSREKFPHAIFGLEPVTPKSYIYVTAYLREARLYSYSLSLKALGVAKAEFYQLIRRRNDDDNVRLMMHEFAAPTNKLYVDCQSQIL